MGWLRALVVRLHFYVGIFVGPFLLVAALSGTLYSLSPQLEPLLYSDQLDARTHGPTLPLAEQVDAAQRVVPDSTLTEVRPAPEHGDTTRVMFDSGTLGESESQTVFIDPATGESQGVLTTYGTSGALPMRMWIDQCHRSLLLGEPGRLYSELAASWLWVLALGGAALWLTHPARRRRVRSLLVPDRSLRGRARTRGLHGALGIWVVVGFLGLSATGLTWSAHAGNHVAELREQLGWTTPVVETTTGAHAEHSGDHGSHHDASGTTEAPTTGVIGDADLVLAAAKDAGVDAAKVQLMPPADSGHCWTVTEIDRSWPTQVDAAAVDPATLEVVDVVRFDDYPLMAKMARWGIDAHTGTLFGPANQIALTALGLSLVAMVVLGFRMWWQRRPTTSRLLALGRPYPRGALRNAPIPAVVLIGTTALAVGWFLPLLGVSLAAFLLLDIASAHTSHASRRRSQVDLTHEGR